MDYHKIDFHLSVEEAKKAHLLDLAVQEKYNVRYIQYWFNEKLGIGLCLMEAPDAVSCVACHLESQGSGGTPCNIQEVEPIFV